MIMKNEQNLKFSLNLLVLKVLIRSQNLLRNVLKLKILLPTVHIPCHDDRK